MRRVRILEFTVAALAASAATAAPLKQVPASLSPTKAYVLVEYKLQKNPFAGFPGSSKNMPLAAGLTLARYDPQLADIRGLGRAKANPVPAGQVPAESFRNRPVAKGADSRLFLLELDPDIWIVQGWGNTSFSLGSYALELKPGQVTDLGVVSAEADWAEGQRPPTAGSVIGAAFLGPFAKRPDVAPMRVSFRPRTASDMAIPAGIPPGSVRQAEFKADATFGNYLGGLVNRIEGVNARLKASEPVPSSASAISPQNN